MNQKCKKREKFKEDREVLETFYEDKKQKL